MVSGEGRDCAGVIGILSDSKPIKQEEDGDREIEREGGGGGRKRDEKKINERF